MANENKTPGTIISPAQGPSKPEHNPVTVHVNARGQSKKMARTEPAVDKLILDAESEGYVLADSPTLNTPKETMGDLAGKLEEAQSQNWEWIETTLANMCKLMPKKAWEKQGYFCHKGVKVCEFGKKEEIEERESKTVHERMHPEEKTVVISGAI